jgi:DNA-binding Lrp family transcriptional regulator
VDETDNRLLDIIQDDFPLIDEPFHKLASLLNISSDDVIMRLQRLKSDGIIRRIGAILDSKKLGYFSTLCAMKVPLHRVGEVAKMVNGYTGVTHNYIRDHDYNMWFTITARSQQELEKVIAGIKENSSIGELMELPAVRMFKIRVRFPMSELKTQDSRHKTQDWKFETGDLRLETGDWRLETRDLRLEDVTLTEVEKNIIREIQGDIPLYRPFETIADKLGIQVEELLEKIQKMKAQGTIRRFGAIVRHRNLGFRANAMGVWVVPDNRTEEVGIKMAAFPQVSHCYQRPIRPGWPYNLFTMIHGKSAGECEKTAKLISEKTEIKDYCLLYSTRELKKASMKYFAEGD